jgi:hypothetical protein
VALLDGAADIFEGGGKTSPEVDEDIFRALHAKIARLARERHAFESVGETLWPTVFCPEG